MDAVPLDVPACVGNARKTLGHDLSHLLGGQDGAGDHGVAHGRNLDLSVMLLAAPIAAQHRHTDSGAHFLTDTHRKHSPSARD
ncbi:hypothetical protein OG530_36270 [Streptomyces decoyicus]|uniref:hypothetical protein n=1 Tax=Streptomyces decoyicus TaxID=249567 RepID=UPI002E180B31